jgi:hypothetical protein
MIINILRSSVASPKGEAADDRERPLTVDGLIIADHQRKLIQVKEPYDVIVAADTLRAIETACALSNTSSPGRIHCTEHLYAGCNTPHYTSLWGAYEKFGHTTLEAYSEFPEVKRDLDDIADLAIGDILLRALSRQAALVLVIGHDIIVQATAMKLATWIAATRKDVSEVAFRHAIERIVKTPLDYCCGFRISGADESFSIDHIGRDTIEKLF